MQQAVEKALKGLLIYYRFEPKFTHNIKILLKELIKFTDIPENIKETIQLNIYSVQMRYQGEYDEVTKEEYENNKKIANICM